jgi:hypothetical protein
VKVGQAYVDVGTLDGYRAAMKMLAEIDTASPRDGDARRMPSDLCARMQPETYR